MFKYVLFSDLQLVTNYWVIPGRITAQSLELTGSYKTLRVIYDYSSTSYEVIVNM